MDLQTRSITLRISGMHTSISWCLTSTLGQGKSMSHVIANVIWLFHLSSCGSVRTSAPAEGQLVELNYDELEDWTCSSTNRKSGCKLLFGLISHLNHLHNFCQSSAQDFIPSPLIHLLHQMWHDLYVLQCTSIPCTFITYPPFISLSCASPLVEIIRIILS